MTIRRHYAASVERLSEDVVNIIDALKTSGHLEITIVIIASDHGGFLRDYGLTGKSIFYEPSIHVPWIVTDLRSPKKISHTRPRCLLDLFPSFLNWAGADKTYQTQGRCSNLQTEERIVVGLTVRSVMARSATQRLVRYQNGIQDIYDLLADPAKMHNLINQRRLASVLAQPDAALAN